MKTVSIKVAMLLLSLCLSDVVQAQFTVDNNSGCEMDIEIYARLKGDTCNQTYCAVYITCNNVTTGNSCQVFIPTTHELCGVRAKPSGANNFWCPIWECTQSNTCSQSNGCDPNGFQVNAISWNQFTGSAEIVPL